MCEEPNQWKMPFLLRILLSLLILLTTSSVVLLPSLTFIYVVVMAPTLLRVLGCVSSGGLVCMAIKGVSPRRGCCRKKKPCRSVS